MDNSGKLTVGILGLGLIGGSAAKAYKSGGHTVYGYDTDSSVTRFAILAGASDGELDRDTASKCDIILLAVFPSAAADYIRENAPYFNKKTVIVDLCGTKRIICPVGFAAAAEYGFTYFGGHPMAGTHYSGFKYSDANLFRGAPMVLVPPVFDDIALIDRVEKLLSPLGFGSYSVTTAEEHDRMIAFTSQLAHIVSGAFIKSPTASLHKGFSAGSYRDMTRVAWLNPDMWTELFLENGDNLTLELDSIIDQLTQYRDAIANDDAARLHSLLDDGRKRKEEVDGNDKDNG